MSGEAEAKLKSLSLWIEGGCQGGWLLPELPELDVLHTVGCSMEIWWCAWPRTCQPCDSRSANICVPDVCHALGKPTEDHLSLFPAHPPCILSLTFPGASPFPHFDFQVCNSCYGDDFTWLIQDGSDSNSGQPLSFHSCPREPLPH